MPAQPPRGFDRFWSKHRAWFTSLQHYGLTEAARKPRKAQTIKTQFALPAFKRLPALEKARYASRDAAPTVGAHGNPAWPPEGAFDGGVLPRFVGCDHGCCNTAAQVQAQAQAQAQVPPALGQGGAVQVGGQADGRVVDRMAVQQGGQLVAQPDVQPAAKPAAQPVDQSVVQPIVQPDGRPGVQPVGQHHDQAGVQPANEQVVQHVAQPMDPAAIQPAVQPNVHPAPQQAAQLADNQHVSTVDDAGPDQANAAAAMNDLPPDDGEDVRHDEEPTKDGEHLNDENHRNDEDPTAAGPDEPQRGERRSRDTEGDEDEPGAKRLKADQLPNKHPDDYWFDWDDDWYPRLPAVNYHIGNWQSAGLERVDDRNTVMVTEKEDGSGWVWTWVKTLGKGGFGTADLWALVHTPNNTIKRTVVVKSMRIMRTDLHNRMWWEDESMTDLSNQRPLEVAVHRRLDLLGKYPDTNILEYYAYNVDLDARILRIYTKWARFTTLQTYTDLGDLRGARRAALPLPFIWYTIRALVRAALCLEDGSVGGGAAKPDWVPLVHRDIKPYNILLDSYDRTLDKDNIYWPVPVLADFGGAVELREPWKNPQDLGGWGHGTNGYCPPEMQARIPGPDDMKVGYWTNIFQIGLVAYALLTDRLPVVGGRNMYEDDPEGEVALNIWKSDPVPWRQDAELRQFIDGCLGHTPKDRWRVSQELLDWVDGHFQRSLQAQQGRDWLPFDGYTNGSRRRRWAEDMVEGRFYDPYIPWY